MRRPRETLKLIICLYGKGGARIPRYAGRPYRHRIRTDPASIYKPSQIWIAQRLMRPSI